MPVSELSLFQPFLSKQSQSDKYFVRQVGLYTRVPVPFLGDIALKYLSSLSPIGCLLQAQGAGADPGCSSLTRIAMLGLSSILYAMQAAVRCFGCLLTVYSNNDTGSNPIPFPDHY